MEENMSEFLESAKTIIEYSLKIRPQDKVILVYDDSTKEINESLEKILEDKKIRKYAINLDNFERPIKKGETKEKIKNIIESFEPTASIFLARSVEGEIKFRIELLNLLTKKLNVRHVHMPGIGKEIYANIGKTDYRIVKELTEKVYDLVRECSEIKVFTDLGTEIRVEPGKEWIIDDGIFWRQGEWGNLPAGEVFTAPKKFEGKIIVDGCIGDYFSEKYGKLKEKDFINMTFSGRELKSIECKNKELEEELKNYIFKAKNGEKVGEFAIGTNIFIKEIIGNMLQDEKYPTIHFALGDPYGKKYPKEYESDIHLDFLVLSPTVIVDGKKIMENGIFLLE